MNAGDARQRRAATVDAETAGRSIALLRAMLVGYEAVLPFAEAVIHHLEPQLPSRPERDKLLRDVVRLLRADGDASEDGGVELLVENPPLLASFFQNTDLLDPLGSESARIARLVMAALERIEDAPPE